MAAVIANEFAEATDDLYLHALIEIGLVLFVITLIINVISRLFIWSMGRQRRPRRERCRGAEGGLTCANTYRRGCSRTS